MKVEQDSDRRVIYEPGDVVGVANYNFLGKLARFLFVPRTPLYHFLLIDAYIESEDDYSVIESVAKGPTMGRLSWYRGKDYQVFRVNEDFPKFWSVFRNHQLRLNASRSFEHLGQIAVDKASRFGRHGYDFGLYLKLLVGVLQFQVGRLVRFQAPRRMKPEDVPYGRDQAFICTELVFEAWRAVGINLRADGHAPLPCEFVLSKYRGELLRIDFHNGTKGQAWRSRGWATPSVSTGKIIQDAQDRVEAKRLTTVNIPRETLEGPGPDIIARQGGQKRNRYHIYRQPYGYPIRLCDWVAADETELEDIRKPEGIPPEDLNGWTICEIESQELSMKACSHCVEVLHGRRTSIGDLPIPPNTAPWKGAA